MSTNQLAVKNLFERNDVKEKFKEILGKRSSAFITSVLQIVVQNQLLANADPVTVYQAAAVAATLDLPLNQNLGFAYIVPYNQKYKDGSEWKTKSVAQFQMGYKGFIQLAQRSGQFKSINSAPVYEGQIINANPLDGYEFDFSIQKENAKIIGYAAKFKLINGFEATYFMSNDDLQKHGSRYSKTFNNDKGLWNTDFDAMARKTVIKLLLSRFAPLSIEMQTAVITDQSVIKDAGTNDVIHIDNLPEPPNKEEERLKALINDAASVEELIKYKVDVYDAFPQLIDNYEEKLSSFAN